MHSTWGKSAFSAMYLVIKKKSAFQTLSDITSTVKERIKNILIINGAQETLFFCVEYALKFSHKIILIVYI